MESLEAEEYMEVVTVYRCKFCDFAAGHPKDIRLHVQTVHIKPRTVIVARSESVTSNTSGSHEPSKSGSYITVLPNSGSECINSAKILSSGDSNDISTDVVSIAARESNLNIQKEPENDIEGAVENEVTENLETMILENGNNAELNSIMTYYKDGENHTGQVVGYIVDGQAFSTATSVEGPGQSVVGQCEDQICGNGVQIADKNMAFNLISVSGQSNTVVSDYQTKAGSKSGNQVFITDEDMQEKHEWGENKVIECENENASINLIVEEPAPTYETENTDTADTESDVNEEFDETTEQKVSAGVNEQDDNNMHIIIENNNDSTIRRISIDTLKKALVENNVIAGDGGTFEMDLSHKNASSTEIIEDHSVVTTKELYLCGNCSAGFSNIQACKDHMLADHGQYAEENPSEIGFTSDTMSSKIDACTQVEPRKKPGRKKKSEVITGPEPTKEETVIDSGSDEDWSEKLNVDYSRTGRTRRKRRPPTALKNDYYLGKKGKLRKERMTPEIEEPIEAETEVNTQEKTVRYLNMKKGSIFRCSVKGCTAKFKNNDLMEKHLECHVAGAKGSEPGFRCLKCDERFPFWKQARYHMWKVHREDVGMLTCEVCNTFKTDAPSKLKAHMEIHSSDRPYACPVCKKGFKQLAQMKNHVVIHKEEFPDSEGKWYASKPCDICGRVFANAKCLKKHVDIVHGQAKPFKCRFCNHTCSRKAMMQLHERIHTQEKPFKCDSCNFAASDHNSLRRHKMRHTGQRPYRCPHCPYACIQAVSLKVHIKNKHPGQEGVFVCNMCLYKTLNKTMFEDHLRDHKNGLVETLDTPTKTAIKSARQRRQKPLINPQITNITVHPNLFQQLQGNRNQSVSQIITLQATQVDKVNSQQQIIQLPSNPQVMQVEMQVQTNADGQNVTNISEEEFAKLNNFEGLVQSDVAAAQLIFSALNAMSQNTQQSLIRQNGETGVEHNELESNSGVVQKITNNNGVIVQEIAQDEMVLKSTVDQHQGVTHTYTLQVPDSGEINNEQVGVTLVEVTEGADGIELAQQLQSGIPIT